MSALDPPVLATATTELGHAVRRWCRALPLLAVAACDRPSTASPVASAEPSATAATVVVDPPKAATATPVPSPAVAIAAPIREPVAPSFPIDQAVMLRVRHGKLVGEVSVPGTRRDLDAIARRTAGAPVSPKTKGLPPGFHAGDTWVLAQHGAATRATLAEFSFPQGDSDDGSISASLTFVEVPATDTRVLAWPSPSPPPGLTGRSTGLDVHPDDATLARVVDGMKRAGTVLPPLVQPTVADAVVVPGRFAAGHTRLVAASLCERDPEGERTSSCVAGVWTLPDGSGDAVSIFASDRHDPIALRSIIDLDGDGTDDLVVVAEHAAGDDNSVTTYLVWWEHGAAKQAVVAGNDLGPL